MRDTLLGHNPKLGSGFDHLQQTILHVKALTKSYGNFLALDNFECEIPAGVTGLLGPNGAGKTTFIRALLGIHPIDTGQMIFKNWDLPRDIVQAKDYLGYQPEVATSINKISAIRYVGHMGRMAGLSRKIAAQRAFDTLHYVGLEEARYREMQTFSQGMLQKVKLAAALVHDPELLILDEPTAGCDPESRESILSLIEELGKTYDKDIIISTHLLPDIERTANYVVVMSEGKRIMQGELHDVMERKGTEVQYQIRTSGDHAVFASILEENGFKVMHYDFTTISCLIDANTRLDTSLIFQLAREAGQNIRLLSPYRQTLEDVFVEAVQ